MTLEQLAPLLPYLHSCEKNVVYSLLLQSKATFTLDSLKVNDTNLTPVFSLIIFHTAL